MGFDKEFDAWYDQKRHYLEKYCDSLQTKLRDIFYDEIEDREIHAVYGRTKAKKSLLKKIKNNGFMSSMEKVTENVKDIVGCRVVYVYKSSLSNIITKIKENLEEYDLTEKDLTMEIKESGKLFGYEAIHLRYRINSEIEKLDYVKNINGINVEIQVMTIFNETWAIPYHELGYKPAANFQMDYEHEKKLFTIKAMLDASSEWVTEVKEQANQIIRRKEGENKDELDVSYIIEYIEDKLSDRNQNKNTLSDYRVILEKLKKVELINVESLNFVHGKYYDEFLKYEEENFVKGYLSPIGVLNYFIGRESK